MRAPRQSLWFYAAIRSIVVGFCRLYWRLTIDGKEHVPADRPFILAPVHRSNIDTLVVAALTKRRLRYMGKDTMWKYGWSAWLFSALGAFPVHRGTADREALRRCVEVLKGGEPLVLFPEGTRRTGPVVEKLYEGAAYLALRTGAPILPVGIGGSEHAMPRGSKMLRPVKVHMVVGPPIDPDTAAGGRAPRRAVHELTERLQAEVQRLFDLSQARVGRL